jgi:hypothetical protein
MDIAIDLWQDFMPENISDSQGVRVVKQKARMGIKLGQHEETEDAIFSQSSIWRKDLGVHVGCLFEQRRK